MSRRWLAALLAILFLRGQTALAVERLSVPDLSLPAASASAPAASPETAASAAPLQGLPASLDASAAAIAGPDGLAAPAAAAAPTVSAEASARAFDGVPFLPGFDAADPEGARPSLAFLKPNEEHPEHALPIFEQARPGVYLSVGTERGFISAAVAGATHLLLVDRNPAAAAYNRANAALLALARDREDYRRLRQATLSQVSDAAEARGWDAPRVRRFQADFRIFRGEQEGNKLVQAGGRFFQGVNYLLDDALFGRLKSLADAGKIGALTLDLNDGRRVAALADALASAGLPLGVVDVSNAWWQKFMGVEGLNALASALARVAHPRSIVLTTDGGPGSWRYHGFLPYSSSADGPLATADLSSALTPLGAKPEKNTLLRVGAAGPDGDFLSTFNPEPPAVEVPVSYVTPNELRPRDARRILRRAPKGAYVSVGTERGFVGAALARSSHLLLVDRDPKVAAYNRYNAALLRLATDQLDYARLRYASRSEIEKRDRFASLDAADRETLVTDFEAFSKNQRDNPIMTSEDGAFKGANYVRDPALFASLKSMADGRRIKVIQARLGEPKSDVALAGALLASGVPLAVLDLSNAWSKHYMGYGDTSALVRAFARAAEPNSIVMVTRNGAFRWSYYGFKPYGKAKGSDEAANLAPALSRISSYAPNRLYGKAGAPWLPRRWLNAALNFLR